MVLAAGLLQVTVGAEHHLKEDLSMGSPALLARLIAAALCGAFCMPGSIGAADNPVSTAPRRNQPAQIPTTVTPPVTAKKMLKLCSPEVRTIAPPGCYEPGTSIVTLSGVCLGNSPGAYRLLLDIGGTSTAVRHKTWEDDAISFTLPKGRSLTPGATGFASIADASKMIVAVKQPFTICQAPARTMKPPATPARQKDNSPARTAGVVKQSPSGSNIAVLTTPGSLKTATREHAPAGSRQSIAMARPGGAKSISDTNAHKMLPDENNWGKSSGNYGMMFYPTLPDENNWGKSSGNGGKVQWQGFLGARATYTRGIGFVDAAQGITVREKSLKVESVRGNVSCPAGQAVKSVTIMSVGGVSNTLVWPYAAENNAVNANFEFVGLFTPSDMESLGPCPKEPAFSTVAAYFDFFFVFFCQGPDGGITIPEQQVAFSIPVALKCYQDSGFRATQSPVEFRHECPQGYVIKTTGQPSWEGPANWSDPKVCVKTP